MKPLAGYSVVVTRPAGQAEAFCQGVERLGGHPLRLPAVEIEPIASDDTADRRWDIVIFTSPNAVTHGNHFVQAGERLLAVGQKTAASLADCGCADIDMPDGAPNSENLLDIPALQAVSGARILIVKGQQGRRKLAETLAQRQARVETAEVYRRVMPAAVPSQLAQLFAHPGRTVLAFTSGDIAQNLVTMVGSSRRERLLRLPLVVGSPRIGDITNELGFRQAPEIADSPADAPMLEAVRRLVSRLKR